MKAFALVMVLFLLGAANVHAQSKATAKIRSHGLSDYYCAIDGETQGDDPQIFKSTKSVFAKDESEALKLCLLIFKASTFNLPSGEVVIMGRDPSWGENAFNLNDIRIRKGNM